MKTLLTLCGAATALTAGLMLTSDNATSQSAPQMGTFSVTITNLTRGQIFSPPVIATHRPAASMFEPGTPASKELQTIAEDGDNGPMASLLMSDSNVFDVQTASGGIMPGMSTTMTITADTANPLFSLASMLVTTNDAFVGLNGVRLPLRGEHFEADAYDAGTEFNSEDCMYIPGPPCGSGGMHDPAPAEGYVYVSNGIHGTGSLNQAETDWRGPVAQIEITRL